MRARLLPLFIISLGLLCGCPSGGQKQASEDSLHFDSDLELRVFVIRPDGKRKTIGATPSTEDGVTIPEERQAWGIEPRPFSAETFPKVVELLKKNEIPGLSLAHSQVTAEQLALLEGTVLRYLNLSHTRLDDAGLKEIGKITTLVQIEAAHTDITDAGIPHLQSLASLTHLNVGDTAFGDKGLEALKKIPSLTNMDLNETQLTDAGVVHLTEMPNAANLDFARCQIGDAAMKHVGKLDKLYSLAMEETNVGDAGLAHLKPLKNLEKLAVSATKVTDAGLPHLMGHSKLSWLDLSQNTVTDAGLEPLQKLSSLERADLEKNDIGDDGLVHLIPLKHLTKLSLGHNRLSDAGMEHLSRLPALHSLDVGSNEAITDEGVEALAACKTLRKLNASNTQATTRSLSVLPEAMIGLDLGGHTLTVDAISAFEHFASLRSLSLEDCDLEDQAVIKLVTMHPDLTQLNLNGNAQLTDAVVSHLAKLEELMQLELKNTKVSEEGLGTLKEALPAAEVEGGEDRGRGKGT